MVKLLSKSPVELNSPYLTQWDLSVRENFSLYQKEIDKATYALQRSLRGFWIFGSTFYPALTQHYNQRLELYQLKQQLGKIEQAEVNSYKVINPSISKHLNNTFCTKWLWPTLQDVTLAAGLQVYAQLFNFAYSWRLGFLIVPYWGRVFYDMATSYQSKHQSLEFLGWALQVRKAKSQIERNQGFINTDIIENYKRVMGQTKKGPLELYQEVITQAQNQAPNL